MNDLSGRVAIVTGGHRHLGRAYAIGLARAGARVVVADIADAGSVVEEIRRGGGQAEAVRADVTDADSTEAMAQFAVDRFGRIDVLVNNAGYFKGVRHGAWNEIPIDEWDKSFAVNVKGTWLACRAVFPYMKARTYGKIINVSSGTVSRGVPGFLHYVSAKSAIVGLTRALAREVGDYNICVNTLAPSYVPDDEMLRSEPQRDQLNVRERIFKRTQVPEDLVGTVVFLASPASDFITGQSLLVNGGASFQ
jgi:3-oxoacyl-[acyl-carrier protein] reductase